MARKPTKAKMNVAAETAPKPVRVDLAPEVHRLLRLVAAQVDMSMAAYARSRLEEAIREEAKRYGAKP